MPRPEMVAVPPERLARHPAARAWKRLRPRGRPSEIGVLKQPAKGIKKSVVYLLAGAGPDGGSVIAKCSRRATAEVEASVYGDLLTRLDMPTAEYYGTLDEGGPYAWLFMEYVPGLPYSPEDPAHRRLLGRWLAHIHREISSSATVGRLPERGMDHHLGTLEAGQAVLAAHAEDPSAPAAEAAALRGLVALLEQVRASWGRLAAISAELPPTLVHGDLVRKNLRVGRRRNGPALIAFDWENAGWGAPALDLAQASLSARFAAAPCLEAYRSTGGSAPAGETVARAAGAGTVLRFLAAIHWASLSLGPSWREGGPQRDFLAKRPKTLPRLEAYLDGLAAAWRDLDARGWV